MRFLPKLMLGSRQSTSQESITFKLRLNWMTLLRGIVVTTRVLPQERRSFHLSWSYSSLLQPEWYVVFVHHMISFVPLPYCIHLHRYQQMLTPCLVSPYCNIGRTITWDGDFRWGVHGYWNYRCWFPSNA